ncbi:zinc ABC transporter substrate-binding protein [Lachnospiraceae bacterium]|nr:zinc ABC transporter substrate-binding protein [Lachnospiraceae bacterium]
MRKNKYLFVSVILLAITLASGIFTKTYMRLEQGRQKDIHLRVVTSFYPVYIAALNVTENVSGVTLANLSEPQTGCMHDYQLTPQDMILLSQADLFLVNGGGIENFLTKVGEAYPGLIISRASEGLKLLPQEEGLREESHLQETEQPGNSREEAHIHGGENAHAWMDTELYGEMVQNIAAALSKADPQHRKRYHANADAYCKKIEVLTEKMQELRKLAAGEPVVILHEAYAYVAEELGMEELYCLNLDEERQISASEVANVIEQISEREIKVVLAEEAYGKDMGETLKAETDVNVCYLDTLVRGDYQKDSYLSAVLQNIETLRSLWQD